MADRTTVSPEVITRVAAEIAHVPIPEAEVRGLAELLNHLSQDMAACRRMPVGEAEPALLYDPTGA